MSTLTDLLARVAIDLKDPDHAVWSDAELTRSIRWALHELSWAAPRRGQAVLPPAQGHEHSLTALGVSGLLYCIEVWYPYDPEEPEAPARPVGWRLLDDDTLRLEVSGAAPGRAARLIFGQAHTLAGLDEAVVTTLNTEQEELVCMGAGGHAVQQRALAGIAQINVTLQAPRLWREWGEERLHAFRARLQQMQAREQQWRSPWTCGWSV